MLAQPAQTMPAAAQKHRAAFFRQSGWMMVTTVAGGGLMYAVHKVACQMPKEEYAVFTTLLQFVALIGLPAVGLQGVFAQQAAASLHSEHERELAGVYRGVLRGTFFIWLFTALAAFLLRNQILTTLKIANPAALWVAIFIGLGALWRPIVIGVMQGRQIFMWLGWAAIIEGFIRLGGIFIVVGLLSQFAAGAMTAVLAGILVVMLIGGWFSRDCLRGAVAPMDWPGWLRRVVPLTLGLGVGSFMLCADMIFVQRYFTSQQGYYAAAGMIGRALVYFTAPLTTVMFPKLARSKALGEKSSALLLTLGVTILAGGCAAIMCTAFPSLPLRIVYDKTYVDVASPLVPWFAWCMLPLTLANVLINSLMAHSRFSAVPWLVSVATGYAVALSYAPDGAFPYSGITLAIVGIGAVALVLYKIVARARLNPFPFLLFVAFGAGLPFLFGQKTFKTVILTLGVFGIVLVAVCAWFTWKSTEQRDAGEMQKDGGRS